MVELVGWILVATGALILVGMAAGFIGAIANEEYDCG